MQRFEGVLKDNEGTKEELEDISTAWLNLDCHKINERLVSREGGAIREQAKTMYGRCLLLKSWYLID